VHDFDDPFASIQRQQGLRPLGHPLQGLPIAGNLLQPPTVGGFQAVR
jgi:hypothetical protein